MAASFTIRMGWPKALWKSKPTHPAARLWGSAIGFPCRTAPGYPIDTALYFQSGIAFRIAAIIFVGVMPGPEGNLTGVLWLVASNLIWVPPTSMTSIAGGVFI